MAGRAPERGAERVAVRRIVIIAARFNEPLTRAMVEGARDALGRGHVADSAIDVVWVPGSFELPVAAAAAASTKPDAIVAIGCLIKGQTPQYAVIGQAVTQSLSDVAVRTGVPIGLGVVIAESAEQARARAGGAGGNRGEEAAAAALEMVGTLRCLRAGRAGRSHR